jgi:hypothetical protein
MVQSKLAAVSLIPHFNEVLSTHVSLKIVSRLPWSPHWNELLMRAN